MLAWTDPAHTQPPRPLLTNIPVIENACSIKPKLFGNFLKLKEEYATQMTTTSWAYFKVFYLSIIIIIKLWIATSKSYSACIISGHPIPDVSAPRNPMRNSSLLWQMLSDAALLVSRNVYIVIGWISSRLGLSHPCASVIKKKYFTDFSFENLLF